MNDQDEFMKTDKLDKKSWRRPYTEDDDFGGALILAIEYHANGSYWVVEVIR